ncbi:MAG: AarF/ABC1/UbiB kinase family protein [Acidobacteriia bacterium]|nr:AarF/ABC1/UbiB kinase family protein [Terriglobia bacterium]
MKSSLIPAPLVSRRLKRSPIQASTQDTYRVRGRLATWARLLIWALSYLWARTFPGLSGTEKGRRVRELCEGFGGLWVKAGQLLSPRQDIFGEEFARELGKLQDRSTAFSPVLVREIIERELKLPFDRIFSEFNFNEAAAASIGQTHEARLRLQDRRVAVKVQRPNVARQFRRDVAILRTIAWLFEKARVYPFVRWTELVTEIEQTFTEELDYRLEAASIRKMRKLLRKHRVVAPRVFGRYSTRLVLVMEFIDGVFMSDYIATWRTDPDRLAQWRAENRVDPAKVARRLFQSLCRQVFEDNQFHGDLHPGNIVLLRDSRVALIDFGSVGTLDTNFMQRYAGFSEAMAGRDYTRAADLLLLLSPSLPPVDLEEVKKEIVRWLRNWVTKASVKDLPYEEKSFTHAMGSLSRIMTQHQIPAAWELLRINRTWLAFDASLSVLQPDAAFMNMARRYWAGYQRRTLRRILSSGRLRPALQKTASVLVQAPQALLELVEFGGDILRRKVRSFEAEASKIGILVGAMFSLMVGGLLLGNGFVLMLLVRHIWGSGVTNWIGGWFERVAGFLHLGFAEWLVAQIILIWLLVSGVRIRRVMRSKTIHEWVGQGV